MTGTPITDKGASEANAARFVQTKVAAEIIGMSTSWLEHDRQKPNPEIPFVRIGARSVRYRVSMLLAYAEGRVGLRFTYWP